MCADRTPQRECSRSRSLRLQHKNSRKDTGLSNQKTWVEILVLLLTSILTLNETTRITLSFYTSEMRVIKPISWVRCKD